MCRRHESRLAAGVTAPAEGRQFVTEQCAEFGVSELTDTARLLTSELVTNAVRHAGLYQGRGPTLGVECEHGRLVIDVRDPSPRRPGRPGDPAEEVGQQQGGRGLTLVAALSESWGSRPAVGGGKAV